MPGKAESYEYLSSGNLKKPTGLTGQAGRVCQLSPVTIVIAALVLTIALLMGLGWQAWKSHVDHKWTQEHIFPIQVLTGQVIYFDEVLTMSANMSAVTGDRHWEKRYRQFEPQLDVAIKSLEKLVPECFDSKSAIQTGEANIKLVEMENQLFGLVNKGHLDQAQKIISEEDYCKQKKLYRDGMQQIAADLENYMIADLKSYRKNALIALVSVLLGGPFLAMLWLWVLRNMRRYLKERYLAEQALKESECKFKAMFNNVFEFMGILTTDGVLVEVNQAALNFGGAKESDVIGKLFWETAWWEHSSEQQKWLRNTVNRAAAGEFIREELTNIASDGSVHYIDFSMTPVKDDRGNVVFLVPEGRDITDRKKAEEALLESELRFRDFFENATIGFHLFDSSQTITAINDSELEMIGYGRDEIVDKKTWADLIVPTQKEQFKKHWHDITTNGNVRSLEYTLVHKQGYHVDVTLNASARFDAKGKLINTRGSVLNISERKKSREALRESEKKYRTLFEQSADATLIIEGDEFVNCNKATVEMLGFANKKEFLGTHPSQLSPAFQPDGRNSFEKSNEMISIAFEQGSHRFEWIHKRCNGDTFPVEVLLTDIKLADRNFLYVVWRDITDRKRSENRLRAERVFTDTIINTLPGLFYIFEKSSARFVRRNDNWMKIAGYSEDELNKMTALDFFEEGENRDMCAHRMEEVYNSGSSTMENLFVTKSGEQIPYYFTGERLVIDDMTYLVGLGLDITDRKRAEEERERNRYYLKRAQEIGCLGTWELDLIKNELIWTDENYHIFGIPIETELTYEIFMECIHPNDRTYVDVQWKEAIINNEPYDIEHRILVDDQVKWVREKAELEFDDEGKCVRGTGFTQDITDRKRNEEVLAARVRINEYAATHSSKELLRIFLDETEALTDSEISFLNVIENDQKIISLQAWSTNTLENMCRAKGGGMHFPIEEAGVWADCIREKRAIIHNDFASLPHRKHLPKGHAPITRELLVPVFREDKVVAVLGVGNKKCDYNQDDLKVVTDLGDMAWDIIVRKKAEEERAKLVKRLEYKNRELQDIVYTASHDLRSPLVNIEGFSGELEFDCNHLIELLTEQTDGADNSEQIKPLIKEDIPQSLKFIISGAKKMSSLLDGLLQISRIGTVEIHSEFLEMDKAVKEILASMEHQIKKVNVAVTVDSLPRCKGDLHMLDHVFTNLISNAIKYVDPAKESKIRISGKVDGGMSIYCVADNGIGIAPAHQKKVFEIFHRLNPHDAGGGEGLGLTIITRVMERLGGKIWLESELGKGSKFFIALPTV